MLTGVISMPKNIFANTGTRVSIMFIDKESVNDDPIFINATKLGTPVKEGDNEKTVLSLEEEKLITSTFKKSLAENFSIKVSEAEIIKKKYSFSAGDYMFVKIDYSEMSKTEFDEKIKFSKQKIKELNEDSKA